MTRNFFAHVCNLKVVFLYIAAFTLVAAFPASAQETGSVPDYDRPWQHFAQSGTGEAQGSPVGAQGDFLFPAEGLVTFRRAVPYKTSGYSPYSVAIADVNGDGNPDLIIANAHKLSTSWR